ncbi:MAG: hypothetical protein ACFFHV_21395 [Promethearchaeota archaeon]
MILPLELMILGIVTIIYMIILIGVGLKMAFTYLRVADKVYIYAGISVIGTAFPWSGVAIFFISIVFFDISPPLVIYFLFHGIIIPIASITWILVILDLFNLNKTTKKLLRVTFITFWTILEIVYIILIFNDTTVLGTLLNEIQVDYGPFSEIFLLIALLQMVVTTFMLGIKYCKSDNRKIQFRGIMITIAISIFLFAAILEIFIPIIPIIILARILIIFYSFLYYAGFIFPKWVESLFFKEQNV